MANIRSYRNLPTRIALPAALAASVVASLIVELIIAAIAHGAGAYSDFQPLTFGGLLPPTVVGLLTAVVAWELVRRRAGDPVAVMRRLVPIVVALSWVPDVVLGATHREATSHVAHTTWGEVAALMVMHLFVAAIGSAGCCRCGAGQLRHRVPAGSRSAIHSECSRTDDREFG
jgi:hypothetical protein